MSRSLPRTEKLETVSIRTHWTKSLHSAWQAAMSRREVDVNDESLEAALEAAG